MIKIEEEKKEKKHNIMVKWSHKEFTTKEQQSYCNYTYNVYRYTSSSRAYKYPGGRGRGRASRLYCKSWRENLYKATGVNAYAIIYALPHKKWKAVLHVKCPCVHPFHSLNSIGNGSNCLPSFREMRKLPWSLLGQIFIFPCMDKLYRWYR